MRWLKTIILELFGLFVDDGSFAFTIIAWLGIAWLVLPWLIPGSAWGGAILFAGLAVILTESVWRHRVAFRTSRGDRMVRLLRHRHSTR